MKFFTNTEFGALLGQTPASWIKRLEELAVRQRVRRTADKNRRELLRLGRHLLQDLGFDQKGCPLAPDRHAKIDCSGCRKAG